MRLVGTGAVAALAACMMLAACTAPTESDVALGEVGGAPHDLDIIGKWYGGDEHSGALIHVRESDDRKSLTVLALVHETGKDRAVEWMSAEAHASVIDGEKYYNVKRKSGYEYAAAGTGPGFMIWRADIANKNVLTLCYMAPGGRSAPDPFAPLIAAGQVVLVTGTGPDNKNVDYHRSRLSRAGLVLFLRESKRHAFWCADLKFRRVTD